MSVGELPSQGRSRRGEVGAALAALGAVAVILGVSSVPNLLALILTWLGLILLGLAWSVRRIVGLSDRRDPSRRRDGLVALLAWPVAAAIAGSAMLSGWPFSARVLLSSSAFLDRINRSDPAQELLWSEGQRVGLFWVEAADFDHDGFRFLIRRSSDDTWLAYRPGVPGKGGSRHVVGPWWLESTPSRRPDPFRWSGNWGR